MITATANTSNGQQFLNAFFEAGHQWDAAQSAWHKALKQKGVVATHPNDGWVDRVRHTVHFCYPHIMGELKIGAMVALGDHEKFRLVKLTKFNGVLLDRWSFEEVTSTGGRQDGA